MFRKKPKETWWESTNEQQNAALETPAEAIGAGDTAHSDAATSRSKKAKKAKRKHRWDWWDAAGDLLEVVIDFVGELFD